MEIGAVYDEMKSRGLVQAGYYDELMSRHTSFRIGGPADIMVVPRGETALGDILGLCGEAGIPAVVLGNGSKLLVSDAGIRGVVISTAEMGGVLERDGEDGIVAGCGVQLSRLALFAREHSLSGLEFAYGIPGRVGGAVYMNAGAYGGEIADVCAATDCIAPDGSVVTRSAEEQGFGYRESSFAKDGAVILRSYFRLQHGNPEQIRAAMERNMAARREKQPLEYPSAGSAFRRPEGHFAGALIEQAGLRGYRIGGAQVSEKHCGFIVNRGDATCEDVLLLLAHIERTVAAQTGVRLQREVRVIGQFEKQ